MKKTLKRVAAAVLALTLLLGITAVAAGTTINAAEKTAKTTVTKESGRKTVTIKKLTYDLKDKDENISIDFATKVKWKKSAGITVTDSTGKTYEARLEDKDSDECEITAENLKAGKTYTIVLSGIKAKTDTAYGKLTISFSIPAASSSSAVLKTEELEYDAEDQEINLDFTKKIKLSPDASASVTDSAGRTYSAEIIGYDSDEVELSVAQPLTYGAKYTVTITGIRLKTATAYTSFSQTFTAVDD